MGSLPIELIARACQRRAYRLRHGSDDLIVARVQLGWLRRGRRAGGSDAGAGRRCCWSRSMPTMIDATGASRARGQQRRRRYAQAEATVDGMPLSTHARVIAAIRCAALG